MEQDGFSDRSEREAHDEWDTTANENGGRLTEESDVDQADESPGPQATAYVEQGTEEMAEVRGCIHTTSGLCDCCLMYLSGFEMHNLMCCFRLGRLLRWRPYPRRIRV